MSVRLAAWAIHPAVLQALLVLNVLVLVWRLVAVGQAFFDSRYPAVPGRLGFAGLVVLSILVLAPHAYAWQVGSAADKAFARVFAGGTIGDGGRQPGRFLAVGSVAVDSRGNLYTGEQHHGKRVQKFVTGR